MNLNIVKNEIRNEIGVKHRFLYKGPRGYSVEFDGVIVKCFPFIFLIQDQNGSFLSFSYNDYIISNINILS